LDPDFFDGLLEEGVVEDADDEVEADDLRRGRLRLLFFGLSSPPAPGAGVILRRLSAEVGVVG